MSSSMSSGKGVALVAISGICWGFHGVMIKYAIGLGASFMQVLFVEVSFAFVFFAFCGGTFLKKVRPQSFLQWFRLILIGLATISLVELNALDTASFAKVLFGVYEHSPWVITEAERCRPFATLKELQASCEAAIDRASPKAQVLLIKAHPDLAVKLDQPLQAIERKYKILQRYHQDHTTKKAHFVK